MNKMINASLYTKWMGCGVILTLRPVVTPVGSHPRNNRNGPRYRLSWQCDSAYLLPGNGDLSLITQLLALKYWCKWLNHILSIIYDRNHILTREQSRYIMVHYNSLFLSLIIIILIIIILTPPLEDQPTCPVTIGQDNRKKTLKSIKDKNLVWFCTRCWLSVAGTQLSVRKNNLNLRRGDILDMSHTW